MHFRRSLQRLLIDWLNHLEKSLVLQSFLVSKIVTVKQLGLGILVAWRKPLDFERWWTVTHDSWQISVPNYFTMPCIIIIRKKRKLFYRTQGVDFMVGIITEGQTFGNSSSILNLSRTSAPFGTFSSLCYSHWLDTSLSSWSVRCCLQTR